jgi:hypothetical protein
VRRVHGAIGALAGSLLVMGIPAGCDDGKKLSVPPGVGGRVGSGGDTQPGTGGARTGGAVGSGGSTQAGTGGAIVGGGVAGSDTGTAGRKNLGGAQTGGVFSTGGAAKDGGAGGVVGTGGLTLKGGVGGAAGMGKGGARGGEGGAVSPDGATDASLPKCSEVTTREACDARTDCHSVFEDPGTCGCASSGCCARFKSCADGGEAQCLDNAMCNMVAPHCEPPYVIAYSRLCYEGCVYQDDCFLLPCPQAAPQNGSACSSAYGTCYYEDCAGAGRSLATCVAGTWRVDTAACSAFPCQVPNTDGGALTCTAGQVCVTTTNTSFNVTAACENQTCGTRPMSTSCINGLTGDCSPKYKLSGVVVTCAMPVP